MQGTSIGGRSIAALVLVLAAAAGGCGAEAPTEEPDSELEFTVQADEKAKAETATLNCPGETAKDRDVCAALEVVAPQVFEPVPDDQACTLIYGGPRTATVIGTFEEEPVEADFNQEDGCEIARWNQIAPVLKALGLTA